ncbi:hypothetical protein H0H92_015660, partial [Tricholoma furcatifolium]
VINHRTGERCILTFKPRGWRNQDACVITGQVIDASGRAAYHIAGRWNSQLFARPVTCPITDIPPHPDMDLDLDLDLTGSHSSAAPFLLWRNSEKPTGAPFNLTPFAITLNDCRGEALRPYLPPTDCRLRPDQRAFERGMWQRANDLKTAQEQKQRAVRRAREEGRRAPHRARWFVAQIDDDTRERVWMPTSTEGGEGEVEYWAERERVFKELGTCGKPRWKDVDDIFVEIPG